MLTLNRRILEGVAEYLLLGQSIFVCRLDAIGAIGIARSFTHGGKADRVIHDPSAKPRINTPAETHKNNQPTTLNHFYDRLLKLQV